MKRIIDYIYYRCWDFLSIFNSYDIYFAAIHLLSILLSVISITVVLKANFLNDIWIKTHLYVGAIPYLSFVLVFYFYFISTKHCQVIVEKYKNETAISKFLGRGVMVLVITVELFFMFK
jgi:hypothetical protein